MGERTTMHLQRMMADEPERARVLAVTSGKGGVGKTNIAANLAVCMAASNKKVVLVDADLGLGNLDVVMNITGRYNLWHVIGGRKSLNDVIEVGPGGVEVVCGGSGFEGLANLNQFQAKRLMDDFDGLQENCDVIVADTGAGISDTVTGFCMAADHTLVVTTPEPTAMTDAYAMIKVLAGKGYPGRISLVVNMAASIAEGKRVYRQIADVASRFLDVVVYEAGVLCKDDRVPAGVKARELFVLKYPKSNITAAVVAMAARLARGAAARSQHEGFLKKVVNWFF